MTTTYDPDAFVFNKQAMQMFVKDGDAFVELQKSDLNSSAVSSSTNASATSAFGESAISTNNPFIQSAPVGNFLPSNFRAYTSAGGEAGVENREFKVNTNTSVGGYGAVQSFRSLNYKAGMGGLGRFTARFTNGGVANSWQGVGFINVGDEISFGYSGEAFGIWHRHDGKVEVRDLDITAAGNGAETATVTVNGTAYDVPLSETDRGGNAYEIEQFLQTGASAFNTYQNGSGLCVNFASDGQKTGTFSYSSDGTSSGTWSTLTTGVTKTSDFYPQTEWNIDTRTGLDPTKGNVYQIKYQYLGYGNIQFSIEDPATSNFQPVHNIQYANSNTSPSLGNPSMHMGLYAVSLGSTTDISVYSASMAGYVQGSLLPTRNPRAFANEKNVGSTLTNIFTLRNKRVINGLINQVEVEPEFLTVFTDSSRGATVYVKGNADVTGPTNFLDVGTNLVSEFDTEGTAVDENSGTNLLAFVVPKDSNLTVSLKDLRIRIPPTLRVTVAAKVNGGSASNIAASIVSYEDV